MYKTIIRPILFLFPPEQIHHFVTKFFKLLSKLPLVPSLNRIIFQIKGNKLEKRLMGLKFPNPVGLAAGFDKNASLYESMSTLGFGFIEVGTVTPMPQEGNPKPRMFRLSSDGGLINRMGFNNEGLEAMVQNLKNRNPDLIIGGNIGKNKVTPNDEATGDYVKCFEGLFNYVDYFVVNVSSPNTPNLRELQEKKPLTDLLMTLQNLNNAKQQVKPILLKIAPDLTNTQLDDIAEIIKSTKLAGIIATNTTIDRSSLKTKKVELERIGNGGLSGKPLNKRSTEVIRYLRERLGKESVIIGVGGIFTANDALVKINAGADLVQVYTGFIYEGPALIKRINKLIIKQ